MAKFIIGNIVVVQDIDEHTKSFIRKLLQQAQLFSASKESADTSMRKTKVPARQQSHANAQFTM